MTTQTRPLTETPDLTWSFGAYRYGLEPLFLPRPEDLGNDLQPYWFERDRPRTTPKHCHLEPGGDLDQLASAGCQDDPARLEEIFWFRWITGHQITFMLWRLMGRLIRQDPGAETGAKGGVQAGPDPVRSLITLLEGYSAMLLYTSSCTPEAYHRVIRPTMYRQHHGFSGSWSPDYILVRSLFHGRMPAWADPRGEQALRRAVETNHLVHGAVGERLVPGSRSLLQQSVPEMQIQDRPTLGVIFDQFFLTVRRSIAADEVGVQLLRRLHAVVKDIAANGFYPTDPDALDEEPQRCRAERVLEFEHRFPAIATEVGVLSGALVGPAPSETGRLDLR